MNKTNVNFPSLAGKVSQIFFQINMCQDYSFIRICCLLAGAALCKLPAINPKSFPHPKGINPQTNPQHIATKLLRSLPPAQPNSL